MVSEAYLKWREEFYELQKKFDAFDDAFYSSLPEDISEEEMDAALKKFMNDRKKLEDELNALHERTPPIFD